MATPELYSGALTPGEYGMRKVCYSINETAELLSTSRPAVYEMARAGKLKIVKLGPKKSRIFAVGIAAMLNELSQQTSTV
jgi:excisionase family DNA binding protein